MRTPTSPTGRTRRWSAAALVAALAWVVLPAPAVGAEVLWLPVVRWEMDDGTRTLWDSSGNGVHGWVGARVVPGAVSDGAVGHWFPDLGARSVDPGRLDVVPDHPGLDPGNRSVAVTVRFRTTQATGNIVQKGQARTAGGYFKMETTQGRAYCVFRSPAGTVAVGSGRRVDDGTWHTVRCDRVVDTVTLWLDGTVAATRRGVTGTIANTEPLTIGGKPDCNQGSVDCDYFAGVIDHVRLDVLGEVVK